MSNLPNPASDGELNEFIDKAQGNWEFTIAIRLNTADDFERFRIDLDQAIRIAEANDNTLLFKSIAPVGTTETHIDTRLSNLGENNGE